MNYEYYLLPHLLFLILLPKINSRNIQVFLNFLLINNYLLFINNFLSIFAL